VGEGGAARTNAAPSSATDEQVGRELLAGNLRPTREDINFLRAEGFDVDDDNDPAPENIPDNTTTQSLPLNDRQEWKDDGLCPRAMANARQLMPTVTINVELKLMTLLSLFKLFFPLDWLQLVLLRNINNNIHGEEVSIGEFFRWIGLWFYMATLKGYPRREFWSSKPVDDFDGAPIRFNNLMSKNRFNSILAALKYSDQDPPIYHDKFHQVRQMIAAWNSNMAKIFRPGWVSCLDEPMSPWTNERTCPGWMFVPRKPHPMGNEYHTVCCGISGVMWAIELVEGKDAPRERTNICFADKPKTVGLLLRLCSSIFQSGRVIILDSGFCVLQGIVELCQRGVFASAVIKKRRYWPKHVPGQLMDERMQGLHIGDTDAIQGVLSGTPYKLFVMKDAAYNTKLMSTYGSLVEHPDAKLQKRRIGDESTTFRYTEPFHNHYTFRHAVDDHNNHRHSDISLEETWVTHTWENRVFAFLLAITEINLFYIYRYFIWQPEDAVPLLRFRRRLAKALIYNEYLESESPRKGKRKRDSNIAHELQAAPHHAQRFLAGKWICRAKDKYQKYICRGVGCKRRVRTCCKCSQGHWMCQGCFGNHILSLSQHEDSE
jgi:Transposase IS4